MMVDEKQFEALVLEQEPEERDAFLTEDDVKCLCKAEKESLETRETIVGYPSHPLCKELSKMLKMWMDSRRCPILDLPSYDLLDEKCYVESRSATVHSLTPMLEGLKTLWSLWSDEERAYRIKDILKSLGKRGILDLLGLRKTVGSADLWPVDRTLLERSFNEKHGAGSELTVGARALAKHHHRDASSSWWGTSTGNEKSRNEHALKMMNKILDEATWINIHCLPHEIKIVEVRQSEGYGVRWTADGSAFRGFVEPQMVDGHAVGWRH
ncbi:uncharacterized protein LOC135480562 isoform X2 [Liolophura sinensis]|uniref:uncharacterized protein LOC135480562 isoform X2 n=1 Tax=Liolophura sinensis TaxID=3198878 RepID=UPI003158F20E